MELFLTNYINACTNLSSFTNNLFVIPTNNNHCVTDHPFFQPSESNKLWNNNNINIDVANMAKSILVEYNLPFEWFLLYTGTSSVDDELSYNYQINEESTITFTFLSLNKINEYVNHYKKNGNTRLINLGLTYYGMGYVIIMTWDSLNKKLFFRIDGGASGIEREFNFEYFIGYPHKPASFNPNDNKWSQSLFDFSEGLKLIMNNDFSNKLISY
jgi:type IV secretory pathway VirB6-like protein